MKRYIQLRDYAKNHSVRYRTVWNRFNADKIPNSFKDENNNILIGVINEQKINLSKVVIYNFSSKIYGLKRSKRKTEEIIKLLEDSEDAKSL